MCDCVCCRYSMCPVVLVLNMLPCLSVCVHNVCVHLSMERIEGASAENHTGGEVFSEVCFVYFVCVRVQWED